MEGSSALQALQGKRILILGLGINNTELAAWLFKHGLSFTVRDQNPKAQEQFTLAHPEVTNVSWQIQEDTFAALDQFDVIFRSPAIKAHEPALEQARKRGAIVTSQTRLFFQLCPCEIIGVTGTKGKGTTASLCAAILQAGYQAGKVYLAGNIGVDPFQFVDDLEDHDIVILELSSFQLADLDMSPQVAIMLHVVPEHLNHHGTFESYQDAKSNLLQHQRPNDLAIVNTEYADMVKFLSLVRGKCWRYAKEVPQQDAAWAEHLNGKEVLFAHTENGLESIDVTARRLLGRHNLENILPAFLVGIHYHISPQIMQREIVNFPGLEHRLSYLGTFAGVTFYDDSIATTPESSIAAIEAFAGKRVHLVSGGRAEGQQFDHWANTVVEHCASISFIPGQSSLELQKKIKQTLQRRSDCELLVLNIAEAPYMDTILSGIHPNLQPGDVVLLSPGLKSMDCYKNYKERGNDFKRAVLARYKDSQ